MTEGRIADAVGLLASGHQLPDVELLDHAGNRRTLSELVGGDPTVLQFYRGWWCPKEQAFCRRLLAVQDDAEVAYSRILSVSVDSREADRFPIAIHTKATRRGRWRLRRVRGQGFVAAAYRHRLSRAGDPQLHTHVVVANMTRAEGRWTTLEAHGLYEHKSAGGAVYRAVLRAEVRERHRHADGLEFRAEQGPPSRRREARPTTKAGLRSPS